MAYMTYEEAKNAVATGSNAEGLPVPFEEVFFNIVSGKVNKGDIDKWSGYSDKMKELAKQIADAVAEDTEEAEDFLKTMKYLEVSRVFESMWNESKQKSRTEAELDKRRKEVEKLTETNKRLETENQQLREKLAKVPVK